MATLSGLDESFDNTQNWKECEKEREEISNTKALIKKGGC
jgi:hypothetical protein